MDFRSLKRVLVQPPTAIIALVISIFIYAWFTESRAEDKAKEFCAQISAGSSVDGLIERAQNAGAVPRHLQWSKLSNDSNNQLLMVIFTGTTPLSRHICDVESADNLVINSHYSYSD